MTITEADLTAIIPITFSKGRGEQSLSQKIEAYITRAEHFLHNEIIPGELITEHIMREARNIIAAEALRDAIPALDITFTATGFAVGNNDTLAPASPQRVRALRQTVTEIRDREIEALVSKIMLVGTVPPFGPAAPPQGDGHTADTPEEPTDDTTETTTPEEPSEAKQTLTPRQLREKWIITLQARKFTSTILTMRDISDAIDGKFSYDTFRQNIEKAIVAEDEIARQYISFDLMFAIRRWTQNIWTIPPRVSVHYSRILPALKDSIKKYIRAYFSSDAGSILLEPERRRMLDIVEYIRTRPDIFPQWQGTDTARLYDTPVFRNTKTSGGFFF